MTIYDNSLGIICHIYILLFYTYFDIVWREIDKKNPELSSGGQAPYRSTGVPC